METLFKLASSISTPISLAGFFAAALFLILRQIVAKNIFPRLTSALGAELLKQIVDRLFHLSLVAMCLGFVGYLAKSYVRGNVVQATTHEQAGDLSSLSSPLLPVRLEALSQISQKSLRTADDAEPLIRILTSHIASVAVVLPKREGSTERTSEESAAFEALGNVLQRADAIGYRGRRPEFNEIDVSFVDLSNVYLKGAIFTDSILNDAVIEHANFSNVTLVGVQARRLRGRFANLSFITLQQSCLEGSMLADADLKGAVLTSSDLNTASLVRVNLAHAQIQNSRLSEVDLSEADLTGTDFSNALELTELQIKRARVPGPTHLPIPKFHKSRLTICKK